MSSRISLRRGTRDNSLISKLCSQRQRRDPDLDEPRFASRARKFLTFSYPFGALTQYGCLLLSRTPFLHPRGEKYDRSVEPMYPSPIAVRRSTRILPDLLFRRELVIVLPVSIRLVLTDYTWAGFDLPTTSIIFCSSFVTVTETI